MNIKESFLNSLSSSSKFPSGWHAEDLLGHIYAYSLEDNSPMLKLLAAGEHSAAFPFSCNIRSMDCFLLLYTKEGCGKLLIDNQVHSLTASSLLLLDCREHFRLDIAIEPWVFQVFFVTGDALSYYYSLLSKAEPVIFPVTTFSGTTLCLDKLMSITDMSDIPSALKASSLINTVFTDCILNRLIADTPPAQIAPYLAQLKELFDNHFDEDYSLDELEERFQISKYRLCREFGAAFGASPFKYLNQRRIRIAGHLLLTTNLKIHEVGSKVGIDNTNHFISLFRKTYGTTPLEYKQRMTL